MSETHSGPVKLPKLYPLAARVVTGVRERKGTIAKLIHDIKHPHKEALRAIVHGTVAHEAQLCSALEKTGIFSCMPSSYSDLLLVLAYEVLFGYPDVLIRKKGNKKVDLLLQSEEKLRAAFSESKGKQLQGKTKESSDSSCPRYVRVNTLLNVDVDTAVMEFKKLGFKFVTWEEKDFEKWKLQVKKLEQEEFMKDFHVRDMLVFHSTAKVSDTPLYRSSRIMLHDKGSALVAMALNPAPGALVLDACAAPGIKTTYMASLMMNTGKIWAVDKSKERCEVLRSAVVSSGASKCVQVIQDDFRLLNPRSKLPYSEAQLILLDPSCSGSGMTTRIDMQAEDPCSLKSRLKSLHNMQVVMLKHAMHFSKAERIVYSTCSVHAEENEEVVAEALQFGSGIFELVPALPEWPVRGLSAYPFGQKCARMTTKDTLTSGFFVAMFQRVREGQPKAHGGQDSTANYEQRKRKALPYNSFSAKKGRWEPHGAQKGKTLLWKGQVKFMSAGKPKTGAADVGQKRSSQKRPGNLVNPEVGKKVAGDVRQGQQGWVKKPMKYVGTGKQKSFGKKPSKLASTEGSDVRQGQKGPLKKPMKAVGAGKQKILGKKSDKLATTDGKGEEAGYIRQGQKGLLKKPIKFVSVGKQEIFAKKGRKLASTEMKSNKAAGVSEKQSFEKKVSQNASAKEKNVTACVGKKAYRKKMSKKGSTEVKKTAAVSLKAAAKKPGSSLGDKSKVSSGVQWQETGPVKKLGTGVKRNATAAGVQQSPRKKRPVKGSEDSSLGQKAKGVSGATLLKKKILKKKKKTSKQAGTP